jgi:hypothetical protein
MLINITLSLAGLIMFIAAQDVPLSWIDVNPRPEHDVFLQIDGSVTSVGPSLLYNTGLPQGRTNSQNQSQPLNIMMLICLF